MSISIVTNEDNMQMMARYPDKFFNLAIVDPPYGINASSGASTNSTMRKKIASGKIKGGDWDNGVPDKSYFDELFRVSKNQIIWGGNYFIDFLYSSKGFLIWDKGESIYNRDFAECEMAWSSFDKCARIFKFFPNQANRFHPTQKPVSLYTWIMKHYVNDGDIILDTHLGSGSSRIAAYDLGFDFYGCELDKDYYLAQEARFATHIAQTKLFTPAQIKAEQTNLF